MRSRASSTSGWRLTIRIWGFVLLCGIGSLGETNPALAIQAADPRRAESTVVAGVPFETEPDSSVEAAILRAVPLYTSDAADSGRGGAPAKYVYGRIDLDADGDDEVVAYLLGPFFCGSGGCDLMLFEARADGLRHRGTFPISRLPVIVSARRSNGWYDLYRRESGGGAPVSYVHHAFDGKRYLEMGRLPAEPVPEGTPVLSGEPTFEKGFRLEPRP